MSVLDGWDFNDFKWVLIDIDFSLRFDEAGQPIFDSYKKIQCPNE